MARKKQTDRIVADLAATRERLMASVDRLEQHLSPSRLADRGAAVVMESFGKVKSQVSLDTLLSLFGRR